VAGFERVWARIDEETDPFVRAIVLTQVLAGSTSAGVLDHIDDIVRELRALVVKFDNAYLEATEANSMAPIIHLLDPEHAREYLRRGSELNVQIGNYAASHASLMFLALAELRAGDLNAAADAARDSLRQTIDHAPSYIGQTMTAVVPIVRRRSPADAAVLLGALTAHRQRRHLSGTQNEVDAEARYEASLRRILGEDDYDRNFRRGLAMDQNEMFALTFAELEAISSP
jgi:hypothetical protein